MDSTLALEMTKVYLKIIQEEMNKDGNDKNSEGNNKERKVVRKPKEQQHKRLRNVQQRSEQ